MQNTEFSTGAALTGSAAEILERNHFLADTYDIDWAKLTPEAMDEAIPFTLELAAAAVEDIASIPPEEVTFKNTILALDEMLHPLASAWTLAEHLASVCNTPELRAVHEKLVPRVAAFESSIVLNQRLWRNVCAFAGTEEARALTGIDKRLFDETYQNFADNGANLFADNRARLEVINAELAALTQKYSEHVLDTTDAWAKVVSDPALLSGLPANALALAAADAAANGFPGCWRFTLHAPSSAPVMQYADNADLRREFWEAQSHIGAGGERDNSPLISKILELRHEKARLLGKHNFADFTTARRMARTGIAALNFIEDLHRRVKTHFDSEVRELEAFKAASTGEPAARLAPWDVSYWAEKQCREKHAFDPETLRPYLPLRRVVLGTFELFGRLLGIKVTLTEKVAWYDETVFGEVHDTATGKKLGGFYLDFYPRAGKRGGAWMNHLVTPRNPATAAGERPLRHGLICTNFTPPEDSSKPALLTHDEALTFLHEFGHLMHHICSEVPYDSLGGVNVAWDFVELPSQLFENWGWHKDGLDFIAAHTETQQPIPPELLAKLIETHNYRAGTAMMRQLLLAKLDLDLHIHHEKLKHLSQDEIWNKHLADYHTPLSIPTPTIATHFTHIFGEPTGYAAGYYSYKWAEVLEADAFSRFLNDGLLNAETGRELRQKILAKGNSEPPEKLFRDFLGRDPDTSALLKRDGLL